MSVYFLRSRKTLRENSDEATPRVDESCNSVKRGKRKNSSSRHSQRKRRRTELVTEREKEEEQVLTTTADCEHQQCSSSESSCSVYSEDVWSEEHSSWSDSDPEESQSDHSDSGDDKPDRSLKDELEEKYVEQYCLGEGGYGSVYAGYRRGDLLPVAIKHVPLTNVKNTIVVVDGEQEEWPQEVALMAVAGEPGGASIELLDWYVLQDELVIVMERPEPCIDLYDYIQDRGGFLQEEEAKVILRQLVEGMITIHSKGVLHRDMKLDNVLVQTDPEGPHVRVLDFGCGCFLQEEPYTSYCGTPEYTPPEWYTQESYQAEPCTVWQVGVVLYGMLIGRLPFSTSTEIIYKKLHIPAHLSHESEDLLSCCLNKQSQRRPSLRDILQHTWLQ